ncbi:LiaI-LiaF-like domain-containing protein [Undibacterium fentianense]|uniref:LiaF transmembrane domain-containing protein n=1 Tax=Undibacterium fentianense TaxID=2828728 RepID=A0A941E537_9BURK|nr:DUF5668 domain-containing protein [Undibacterium fentianense]MBR7801322.1 hypothetical protein [Undibacterium fentianense]
MKNRKPEQRLIFGVFIIIFGVLALVDNLRIFSTRDLLQFWPTIFIVFGAIKLSQSRGRSGTIVGGGLILVGSIMTLNHLGILNVRIRDWWPIFLILAGVLFIFKDKTVKTLEGAVLNPAPGGEDSQIDIVAIMSGSQGNIAAQNFRGGEITAVMGGVELDLRNASIQGEAVINVFAFWGGISIKIPQDWAVVNNGSALLGGFEDSTVPGMNSTKRLIITGTAVMGGVEIKN